MINGLSLFSNVGIGETYFKEVGINIVVANELIPKRAEFYKHIHNETNMIQGDITNEHIFNTVIDQAKKIKVRIFSCYSSLSIIFCCW